MKAVFLDRDGVLCKEKSYISYLSQVEFEYKVKEAVIIFKELGYKIIVVTNQSGIARGIINEEELKKIHEYIKEETKIDDIFYCPHGPDNSCRCRKPNIGMFEIAREKFDLDFNKSFMVGDRVTDILAGIKIGAKTVLVKTGYGSGEINTKADYVFDNIYEFAKSLKERVNL